MPIECVGGIQWGWWLIVGVGQGEELTAGQVRAAVERFRIEEVCNVTDVNVHTTDCAVKHCDVDDINRAQWSVNHGVNHRTDQSDIPGDGYHYRYILGAVTAPAHIYVFFGQYVLFPTQKSACPFDITGYI